MVRGKVGSPYPVEIGAWSDLGLISQAIDYLEHLGYDLDEIELDVPTLKWLLETANKRGMPKQVGAYD